jgi:hypothetical protein
MRIMSPEERFERIERIMEFLAANQAKLSASMAAREAENAEHSKQIARHSRQIARHSEQIEEHAARTAQHFGQIADMVLRFGRIVEEQALRMDQGFARLTESQVHTNERLNTLIQVVERHLSNGHTRAL